MPRDAGTAPPKPLTPAELVRVRDLIRRARRAAERRHAEGAARSADAPVPQSASERPAEVPAE